MERTGASRAIFPASLSFLLSRMGIEDLCGYLFFLTSRKPECFTMSALSGRSLRVRPTRWP